VAATSVRASGGGARSAFWRQLLAGILNKRVVTLETQEGSAYGAALLALVGNGVSTLRCRSVCAPAIRETESVSPSAADVGLFTKRGTRVLPGRCTPALKPIYGQIAGLGSGLL